MWKFHSFYSNASFSSSLFLSLYHSPILFLFFSRSSPPLSLLFFNFSFLLRLFPMRKKNIHKNREKQLHWTWNKKPMKRRSTAVFPIYRSKIHWDKSIIKSELLQKPLGDKWIDFESNCDSNNNNTPPTLNSRYKNK